MPRLLRALGVKLMDLFGVKTMFISFAVLISATVGIILVCFPARRKARTPPPGAAPLSMWRFEVLWFFANLMVYGIGMSLVENFLAVYLIREFESVTNFLIGSTIAVMCLFEVPVFLYFKHIVAKLSLTATLTGCYFIFAIRCVLYAFLPADQPYLVLLIEPLHGITFALMWSCSIEYGRRLAPPGSEAKMQALVNGLYAQLSMGLGSMIWGRVTEDAPLGIGFRNAFLLDAAVMMTWCLVWNAAWCVYRRRAPNVPVLSAALNDPGNQS